MAGGAHGASPCQSCWVARAKMPLLATAGHTRNRGWTSAPPLRPARCVPAAHPAPGIRDLCTHLPPLGAPLLLAPSRSWPRSGLGARRRRCGGLCLMGGVVHPLATDPLRPFLFLRVFPLSSAFDVPILLPSDLVPLLHRRRASRNRTCSCLVPCFDRLQRHNS